MAGRAQAPGQNGVIVRTLLGVSLGGIGLLLMFILRGQASALYQLQQNDIRFLDNQTEIRENVAAMRGHMKNVDDNMALLIPILVEQQSAEN